MSRFSKLNLALIASSCLGACATAPTDLSQPVAVVQGPAIVNVSGPYDAAKACIKNIPETKTIRIGVGDVKDVTGRMNITDSGSFLPGNSSKMLEAAFSDTGVILVNMSPWYRQAVDWYIAKGMMVGGGSLNSPQFVVEGSISSLDFLPGKVTEMQIAGVGHNARSYQAVGRGDFSLATFPYNKTTGGFIMATTKIQKQFTAVESDTGVAEFIGGGTGAKFASFRVGKGEREPMQYAIGYMADYAAVDLIATLLETLSSDGKIANRAAAVGECRGLLKSAEKSVPGKG